MSISGFEEFRMFFNCVYGLVLTVVDEMCSFFKMRHSDKRQVFDGLRGSLRACVPCSKTSSKRWPAVAKKRETARLAAAKTERPMTPAHRGRAASGQSSCSLSNLAAVSTCCQFWFTEIGAVVTTAGKT